MFIKEINQFIYSDKIEGFYHLVDLIKAHYEKELEETDKVYSKIVTNEYEYLGKFTSELYFCFKDEIEKQCNIQNINFIKNSIFYEHYMKEINSFKDKTNALFDKYYPKEDYKIDS